MQNTGPQHADIVRLPPPMIGSANPVF